MSALLARLIKVSPGRIDIHAFFECRMLFVFGRRFSPLSQRARKTLKKDSTAHLSRAVDCEHGGRPEIRRAVAYDEFFAERKNIIACARDAAARGCAHEVR